MGRCCMFLSLFAAFASLDERAILDHDLACIDFGFLSAYYEASAYLY